MKRRASRLLLRLPLLVISALGLFSGPAQAENPQVTEATDFWYQFDTESTFFARTYAVSGYQSDPMLWLYNSGGQLLAQNDDYYGLQSRLELTVPAGLYRLRAGVCCGNPNAWWQGVRYELSTSEFAVPATTTTTTLEATTTTETSTTTTEPVTTTTEPLETSTTTTQYEPTTTTVLETTTSSVVEVPSSIETLPSNQSTNTTTSTIFATTSSVEETTTTATTATTEAVSSTTVQETPTTTSTTVQETTTSSAVTRPTVAPASPTPRTTAETTTTSVQPTTTTTFSEPLPEPKPVATTMTPATTTTTEPIPAAVLVAAEIVNANLSEMSEQDAIELIEVLEVGELTNQQKEQLAEKLSDAPKNVKEKFESEVDIYSGGFDSYVPVGSTVPVGTRRVIVAATGVLFSMPVASASASGRKVK